MFMDAGRPPPPGKAKPVQKSVDLRNIKKIARNITD
jgi:hypothetical protein